MDYHDLILNHERVDDIPLIVGMLKDIGLPELVDRCVGTHGSQEGLSNGWLMVGWLAFILSEGDHRKYRVEEWADGLRETLASLFELPVRQGEFADDRLGGLLARLDKDEGWEALESALWNGSVMVYDLPCTSVRLDATTTCGYHTPVEGGLMQLGYSKDHRPDLAQLKLMAAAAQPFGHLLGSDIHPGQAAEEALYTPLVERVRRMLGRSGMLYVGDAKMATLGTRADIAANGDYYLMPLPWNSEAGNSMREWIGRIVEGEQEASLLWNGKELLGAGYEFERRLSAMVDEQSVEWMERVQVVRSSAWARQQGADLQKRLDKAAAAIWKLAPPPGPNRKPVCDEAALQAGVTKVLEQFRVVGLLRVSWERLEKTVTRYVTAEDGTRSRQRETQVRYVITAVERDEERITQEGYWLGWRVYATTNPVQEMTLGEATVCYREGWSLERVFHLLKDRPLGIGPLFVARDDQIRGLTRLLTVALRLLTLIEILVRRGLAEEGDTLQGVYEGLPSHETSRPTATRVLRLFARAQITLTCIQTADVVRRHITPLSSKLERILVYLGLSPSLYTRLAYGPS